MSQAEPEQLYAAREPIFPKKVYGNFRNLKWVIMIVTLGIYYVTPWIRWDRGPSLPDQAVLLDMANRRFYFFWIEIWPHEFYFIAGLLVMAGLGLFLFTSALGRVWCGYTCPQTVWTDLFILVERWIEGDRNARLRLHRQKKWDFRKARLRLTKWVTWLLIAMATGGAWVFYFADAPTLLVDLFTLNAHPIAYTTIAILTGTTFLFGGFAREQICIYACPWPRIQAAMMDEDTLTVGYREWRGEPRGKLRKGKLDPEQGDCIDCMACVNVCPMGIDIRNGQQMECITCALCIDACDAVMDKVGHERGLISYATLADYNHNMRVAMGGENSGAIDPSNVRDQNGNFVDAIRGFKWREMLRLRTIIYTAAWAAIGIALLIALGTRDRLEVNVLHDRNPVFTTLSDGSIRNGYTVKILNMVAEPRTITLTLDGLPGAVMAINGIDAEPGTTFDIPVEPDKLRPLRVFVSQPRDMVAPGSTPFSFIVEEGEAGETDIYNANFEAPE